MNERPILFSAPMVLAIIDGRKTQTRRIVKPNASGRVACRGKQWHTDDLEAVNACPYGKPRDRLWVRETFRVWQDEETLLEGRLAGITDGEGKELIRKRTEYRASSGDAESGGWRPSIFMPRWISRITLEITGVRIERLNRISEDDSIAEGIDELPAANHAPKRFWRDYLTKTIHVSNPIDSYASLWETINGPGSWERDPLVWVVNFRRI